jgi:hypothetical protein
MPLTIGFLAATAVEEPIVPPKDPPWHYYRVTSKDYRDARKSKQPIYRHLFGDKADAVMRFNRIAPKFVYGGRRLKVPELPEGVSEYQPMPAVYPPATAVPRMALIVLNRQFIGLYEFGRLKASFPLSSGRNGHRTPVGDFKASAKDRFHKSSVYPEPHGGWPMPWAVRFYKSYFWIHEGDLPGYPDSHGCVRLMHADAVIFFEWAQIGDAIRIIRSF